MGPRLEPIALVKSTFEQEPPHGWEQTTSRVIVSNEQAPPLLGTEGFLHFIIFFWPNRIGERVHPNVKPQRSRDMPPVALALHAG
jgi:tRNA (Thr-GGU) A37 N-methylase